MGGSTGDQATQAKPTDKTAQQHQTNDAVWSNVSQQLSAPGKNSDASQHAAKSDSSSLPPGFPTNLEITGDTSSTKGSPASKGDSSGVSVELNHGGDVTKATENVNGNQVSLMGADGKPLPGISTEQGDLQKHPPNVQLDANGKIQSYDTANGVKVTMGADGKPQSYNSNGFTFDHHSDGWYSHQDSGGAQVKIDEPKVAADGSIHAKESGGWHHGREHCLNGDGHKTGDDATDRSKDPTQVIRNDDPKTIDDVLSSLDKLQKALPDNDGLKNFNTIYQMVTKGVKEGIDKGTFKDPKFMETLDVNFARTYIHAIQDHLAGKEIPKAWQEVMDSRNETGISKLQFAGAAMMGHINHDLPNALNQTYNDLGINPSKNSPQHDDFLAFNNIVKDSMPATLKAFDHGALGHAAVLSGGPGQAIGMEGVKVLRNGAWSASKMLHAGGTEGYLTEKALNESSGIEAKEILHPGRVGKVDNPFLEIPMLVINKIGS